MNPTISLKKIETSSNDSAGTGFPCLRSLATDLETNNITCYLTSLMVHCNLCSSLDSSKLIG